MLVDLGADNKIEVSKETEVISHEDFLGEAAEQTAGEHSQSGKIHEALCCIWVPD